jgi:hypothetical protein
MSMRMRSGHARLAVRGLDDRVAGAGEESAQDATQVFQVLYD